jgi:hypothetical protein
MLSSDKRTALVIGHPGHELRVFHWLELVRPTVFVLTDGSGRLGQSRLPSTTRILDLTGASTGSFYGRLTDGEAYHAILNRDFDVFIQLARELARFLIREKVSYVASDAFEGYNPTHDVCRLIVGAAVKMAKPEVATFDFPLIGAPDKSAGPCDIKIELDDDAFARKMAAARSYTELESEVNEAIKTNAERAFRVECLRRVNNGSDFELNEKPFYERYGEERVAAGHYRDIIRYCEHILPLSEALKKSSSERTASMRQPA